MTLDNKAVLMSIKPKWCEKIFNGLKFIELRKTTPKMSCPFTVYVYCTKEMILGDFIMCNSYEMKALFPDKRVVGVNHNVGTPLDTNLQGMVIGEFTCRSVEPMCRDEIINGPYSTLSCVPVSDMLDYKKDADYLYGWYITDVILYDTPKEISEFTTYGDDSHPVNRAPQSYMYVNELS